MMTPDQRQALENFATHLAPGARILYAPAASADTLEERQTPVWLKAHGFSIEELDPAKDLRFLTLKRESYDAIWAGRALGPLPIEEAQRVVATFFQALKPKTGILFAAHRYPDEAFASMIRQNGFQLLLSGTREDWSAVIVRRI
jgi:hypothetical protein